MPWPLAVERLAWVLRMNADPKRAHNDTYTLEQDLLVELAERLEALEVKSRP